MSVKTADPKISWQNDVILKRFTHFKIGGKARFFLVIRNLAQLRHIFSHVFSPRDDFYFLGGGSNLLISDTDISRPVITLGKEFEYIRRISEYTVEVGAATFLSHFINYCLRHHLGGVENLAGIPARIGGLVCMNAASFGRDIASCIDEVTVCDRSGLVRTLRRNEIEFGYRYSSLRDTVIINVRLCLEKKDGIKEAVSRYIRQRLSTQDFIHPSAGCIFKNPRCLSAAFLIEKCGLKGTVRGGACISVRHANFIINTGNATAVDVAYLIDLIKKRVYSITGVGLEEEVIRWED